MEIEAKYLVRDPRRLAVALSRGRLGALRLSEAKKEDFEDIYFDTGDRRLLSEGNTLRLRVRKRRRTLSLKSTGGSEGALHRRREMEVDIPVGTDPADPRSWPKGALARQVSRAAAGAHLVRIAEIHQRRVRRNALRAGRAVAEISLDRVTLRRDRRAATHTELEVELLRGGSEADVEQIVALLSPLARLEPLSTSKLERALEAQIASRPAARVRIPASRARPGPGVRGDQPVWEAARRVLGFHLHRMLENEPGARLSRDPERLHAMRVSVRRMRAALRVFGRHVDEEAFARVARDLDRLGSVLGEARDLDVVQERLRKYIQLLMPTERGALAPLAEAVAERRRRARMAMREHLDSREARRTKRRLAALAADPAAGARETKTKRGRPRPVLVRHLAPVILFTRLAEIRAFEEAVARGPPVATFHRLRISAKRLRYAIEALEEALGHGARGAIDDLRQLQDALGELQDAIAAETLLKQVVAGSTREDRERVRRGAEIYLQALREQRSRATARFPHAWAKIRGTGMASRIAALVSDL
jgi:CHAD domain-containing protein